MQNQTAENPLNDCLWMSCKQVDTDIANQGLNITMPLHRLRSPTHRRWVLVRGEESIISCNVLKVKDSMQFSYNKNSFDLLENLFFQQRLTKYHRDTQTYDYRTCSTQNAKEAGTQMVSYFLLFLVVSVHVLHAVPIRPKAGFIFLTNARRSWSHGRISPVIN